MQKKKLNEHTKKHFEEEINEWKVNILEKKHAIAKFIATQTSIQASLDFAIQGEQNKILAAKATIADLVFDFKHQVTYQGLGNQINKATLEIERHEKNIEAREIQIEEGVDVLSKDEKARNNVQQN